MSPMATTSNPPQPAMQSVRGSAFLRGGDRFLPLLLTMTGKDVGEAVVAFVARILVQGAIHHLHRDGRRPRLRERRRILNRDGVAHAVGTHPCEALNDASLRARAEDGGVSEIHVAQAGRLDDKRVSLPPTAGITQPL